MEFAHIRSTCGPDLPRACHALRFDAYFCQGLPRKKVRCAAEDKQASPREPALLVRLVDKLCSSESRHRLRAVLHNHLCHEKQAEKGEMQLPNMLSKRVTLLHSRCSAAWTLEQAVHICYLEHNPGAHFSKHLIHVSQKISHFSLLLSTIEKCILSFHISHKI